MLTNRAVGIIVELEVCGDGGHSLGLRGETGSDPQHFVQTHGGHANVPPVKFALFYEIPVARPWAVDSEHLAYKNTLEQAIAGEAAGFHAFWTVEHHFLEEYSHCSNPEVLYGAIASRTSKMRL